ncbi:MAG: hypothetical protein JWO95_1587 [Verrucomicrobiales bacterium]|nr:hypothetical protein [Verrucomicrobiales bacterium]
MEDEEDDDYELRQLSRPKDVLGPVLGSSIVGMGLAPIPLSINVSVYVYLIEGS